MNLNFNINSNSDTNSHQSLTINHNQSYIELFIKRPSSIKEYQIVKGNIPNEKAISIVDNADYNNDPNKSSDFSKYIAQRAGRAFVYNIHIDRKKKGLVLSKDSLTNCENVIGIIHLTYLKVFTSEMVLMDEEVQCEMSSNKPMIVKLEAL